MRGSCWLHRRTEQKFRQLVISTIKSVKIKLLLCFCIALTVVVLTSSASAFIWTNQSYALPRYSASRFVDCQNPKHSVVLLLNNGFQTLD
ncbi:hypothetical protein L6164_032810 [Bauhinia variegata]|uniref:Uncharacterized protein n=1 Tax=Bauhinia variegata TaxID=167791 RepID=A0ACB9KPX6_BAUVA|nr:hypothetical protein L6164_032810 [Bauhinia variegata]